MNAYAFLTFLQFLTIHQQSALWRSWTFFYGKAHGQTVVHLYLLLTLRQKLKHQTLLTMFKFLHSTPVMMTTTPPSMTTQKQFLRLFLQKSCHFSFKECYFQLLGIDFLQYSFLLSKKSLILYRFSFGCNMECAYNKGRFYIL